MNTYLFSHDDYRVLSKTINELLRGGGHVPAAVQKLRVKLDQAILPDAGSAHAKSVTINSKVRLRDMESGETEEWILVMPGNADPDKGRISVFAPVGAAIVGVSEGDTVAWETPGGPRRWKVEKIEHGAFKVSDVYQVLYG